MSIEEKINMAKELMNELDIVDEDTRHDIYVAVLENTDELDETHMLLDVINPVIKQRYGELVNYRQSVMSLMEAERNGYSLYKNRDTEVLDRLNEIADSISMLHGYIARNYDADKAANFLNIPKEMAEAVMSAVISDIKHSM